MNTPNFDKFPVSYFLNKIPKEIVVKNGFAVTAHNLASAQEFAQRKGIIGEMLLMYVSDSQATLYYSSDALVEMALQMKYEHDEKLLIEWEKQNNFMSSVKRLFSNFLPA